MLCLESVRFVENLTAGSFIHGAPWRAGVHNIFKIIILDLFGVSIPMPISDQTWDNTSENAVGMLT